MLKAFTTFARYILNQIILRMTTNKPLHTFHIPVMGLAYTIDSPIRVAKFGISSVIALADDELIEKMRSFYSEKFDVPYQEITKKFHDYRAERITSYLNLVDKIVKEKFENFKTELSESKHALESYIAMLPNKSEIKQGLEHLLEDGIAMKENVMKYLEEHLCSGDIDVNIMTKLDKDNFVNNEQLPVEFNDAHAALRGFANSNLSSSIVLSAGMNRKIVRLFRKFFLFLSGRQQQSGKENHPESERFPFGDDSRELLGQKRALGFRIPHRIGIELWWTRFCNRRNFVGSRFWKNSNTRKTNWCNRHTISW